LIDHPKIGRFGLQADDGNVLAIVENVERARTAAFTNGMECLLGP
jgi:hypothetical protein